MSAHRAEFEGRILCRVLHVSHGGYYTWLHRQNLPPAPREAANRHLSDRIETVFRRSRGTYGSPRIHAELRATGVECSRNRVARLMRQAGIVAKRRKLHKAQITHSNHVYPVVPNLLNRHLSAERPN